MNETMALVERESMLIKNIIQSISDDLKSGTRKDEANQKWLKESMFDKNCWNNNLSGKLASIGSNMKRLKSKMIR